MLKLDAAKKLITRCESVYGGVLTPATDIASSGNVVSQYAVPENQLKYVHMYFAKYVGCWITIRSRLGNELPTHVTSIGAGPALCALGWYWRDLTRGLNNSLRMYDALTWDGVRSLPEWQTLFDSVYAGSSSFFGAYYAPGNISVPPQLHGALVKPIEAAALGEGGVVLMPYLMNHLLGREGPIMDAGERSALFAWIEEIRSKNIVVISDMRVQSDTHWFWKRISDGLGVPSSECNLNFGVAVVEMAEAYCNPAQQRRRTGPDWFREAGVLVGDRSGWSWLT